MMRNEVKKSISNFCHALDVDMTRIQFLTPLKSVSLSSVLVLKSL